MRLQKLEFQGIGEGYQIRTQIIPLSGLIPALLSGQNSLENIFRYSTDGGISFTDWLPVSKEVMGEVRKQTKAMDIVLDFITHPYITVDPYERDVQISSVHYDKSVFKAFFNYNEPEVLRWALNVLEKLFEPGLMPLYVSRENSEDYGAYFMAMTHFFAFIVVYARKYREIENDSTDTLMKHFIEGWGLIYENIDTDDKRQFLFANWISEFHKRGTRKIADKENGTIEGEVRRLVGYRTPSEFIFEMLSSHDIGWCLGYSSPTWSGTETINALSKGWDFGPDYADRSGVDEIQFEKDEVGFTHSGGESTNEIRTKHSWQLFIGDDSMEENSSNSIGVGYLKNYPLIGDVTRKYVGDTYVFEFIGQGRSGISSEEDKSKLIEVYPGLDYEITVWVKALKSGEQNIEFGVHCFDGNKNLIEQVRITSGENTNSFFSGKRYQSPCKVPNIVYRLRGIIYGAESPIDNSLYLNFENGKPLRFTGDIKYISPYLVQNRAEGVSPIHVQGITVKPLELPFTQGYLGQKNVVVMYSELLSSSKTHKDIENFISRYLLSYKNVASYKWLNWVQKISSVLFISLKREFDKSPIKGALVSLSNGMSGFTDDNGSIKFNVPIGRKLFYTVSFRGISKNGSVDMKQDTTLEIPMEPPIKVDFIIEGEGKAVSQGSHISGTQIILEAKPNSGSRFVKWVFIGNGTESTTNPLNYLTDGQDITVKAVFEKN